MWKVIHSGLCFAKHGDFTFYSFNFATISIIKIRAFVANILNPCFFSPDFDLHGALYRLLCHQDQVTAPAGTG